MLDDARKYVEQLRRFVEASLGTLSPAKARDLAGQAMSGEGLSQAGQVARDLVEWSKRNREQILDLVRGEIGKQLSAMGLATSEDVDALRKRVRALERGGTSDGGSPKRKRPSPARRAEAVKAPTSASVPSAAKRTTRPSAAKRASGASAATAKRTTRASAAPKSRSGSARNAERSARASTTSKRTSATRSTASPRSSPRRSPQDRPAPSSG